MKIMDSVMDIIMGRKEERSAEYMEVDELPEKKPHPEAIERHLKKKYGIELIHLEE